MNNIQTTDNCRETRSTLPESKPLDWNSEDEKSVDKEDEEEDFLAKLRNEQEQVRKIQKERDEEYLELFYRAIRERQVAVLALSRAETMEERDGQGRKN